MISIVFAPPRTGKTVLITHLANEECFNRERYKKAVAEIGRKNANGFNLTLPNNLCSANYAMNFFKFGYSRRRNRIINPYRLGFANPFVETHFNMPYEVIAITEAQKYLNSRMSMYFPEWQSRWYEQHGHDDIEIFLDTQRPMLIDVNIRDLARFIEVIKLTKCYDEFGKINKLIWLVRIIDDSSAFDKYMASGKKDKTCYEETKIVANYNVFECYDSQNCKPKFYQGHFEEDFDINESEPTKESVEGYIEYLKNNDDELPQNYYQKRSIQNAKQ